MPAMPPLDCARRRLDGRDGAFLPRLFAPGFRPVDRNAAERHLRPSAPCKKSDASSFFVPLIGSRRASLYMPWPTTDAPETFMPLKIAVQMDHVSTISIAGDTTFRAVAGGAAARPQALPLHARPAVAARRQGVRAHRGDEAARREGRPLHARRAGAHRPVGAWTWSCCARIRPST